MTNKKARPGFTAQAGKMSNKNSLFKAVPAAKVGKKNQITKNY